jgi:phage terminase small subunit
MIVKLREQAGLSEETLEFMKDVMKELNSRKAIRNIDLGSMRMLATSYELYLRATEMLLKDGAVVQINHE